VVEILEDFQFDGIAPHPTQFTTSRLPLAVRRQPFVAGAVSKSLGVRKF
jgi:hypothetical protein